MHVLLYMYHRNMWFAPSRPTCSSRLMGSLLLALVWTRSTVSDISDNTYKLLLQLMKTIRICRCTLKFKYKVLCRIGK